ncbi:IS1595 family transposase [Membranihabitans marinus]|uniref:IS1595 family transposase n=1 Tax=Membranihabitans marinus TaxID=1227546 RepID=UPI001F005698|nr:IS1595 family transposase [Membranihabitans marinus]
MEAMSKSLSLFDFQQLFPNDESCLKYLSEKKWKDGYKCQRCKKEKFCKSTKKYDRRCTSCGYIESPKANTLFHHMKFSLLKAFYIVYLVSTNKKGISSTELSRKLRLRQKTCWLFKHKVMQAMASRKKYSISNDAEVMTCELGINQIVRDGIKIKKKKLAVLAHEKKSKGRGKTYGHKVSNLSAKELIIIFNDHIDKATHIKTNGWHSFKALQNKFPGLETVIPKKGKRPVVLTYRISCGLLHWIRGTHGHAELLQYYLDEYFFRLNRCDMEDGLFLHLLDRMIKHEPRTYFDIVNFTPKALFIDNH